MHATPRGDDEAVKRNLFKGHDLPAFPFPVRFEIGTCHQMRGQLLDPFRLDRSDSACVDARGFSKLKRHHPFHAGGLLRGVLLALTGKLEFNRTRAEVVIAFDALGADVGDETGEQGAMEVFVFCGHSPTPALPRKRRREITSASLLCFCSFPSLRGEARVSQRMRRARRTAFRCNRRRALQGGMGASSHLRRDSHPRRCTHLCQLRMHIAPLAHA